MGCSNRMFVVCNHDICYENTHCDASPASISTTFCCGNGIYDVGEDVSNDELTYEERPICEE